MCRILAIKGHSVRGKEVIELLEMMGGKNLNNLAGCNDYAYYVVEGCQNIIRSSATLDNEHIQCFTLTEFLKKFPYKVGDKVTLYNKLCTVIWMCWECDNIYYQVQEIGGVFIKKVAASELIPYKEQGDKETKVESKREYDELRMPLDDDDKLATEATIMGKTILPPDGYLVGKITQTDNGMLVEYVEKKSVYPKTIEECYNVLKVPTEERYVEMDNPVFLNKWIISFTELLIARNAYWKIAGEQMGLGKPWKPDWNDSDNKFVIQYLDNEVGFWLSRGLNYILAFPTVEMRDAFYENFKELIEQCKELL